MPPKHGGVQITPPFYAYSRAPRACSACSLDLKAPDGPRGVPAARASAPTWSSRASAPASSTASASATTRCRAREPARRLLLDERLRPGRPARAVGRPRPQLPRPRRLPRLHAAATRRRAAAARARPSPTAPAAGMHAVIAILAALVRRADDRRGRVPRRRRSPTACSRSWRSTSTSTSPPASVPGPGHDLLTGRYACYDIYRVRATAAGSRSARSSRSSSPTSAGCSSCEQWIDHQTDDDVQDEIRADFAPRSRPATATTGSRARAGRHVRRAGAVGPRGRATTSSTSPAARSSTRRIRSTARSDRSGTRSPARIGPRSRRTRRDATTTDTDDVARRRGLLRRRRSRRCVTQELLHDEYIRPVRRTTPTSCRPTCRR